jgi:membrane fusion protein (multidrug efflux system)
MSPEKKHSNLMYVVGILGVVVVIGGVVGMNSMKQASAHNEGQAREEEQAKGPRVRVVEAKVSPPVRHIELQGEARPFASVTLYAKVSGYLKEIRVDKGDKVKPNQLIAIIESPEIDRQYDAAVADANYKRANAKRAAALAGPGIVSAAEADVQVGQAQVAEATVASLAQQKSYETLRAPFAGTVTARYADPGALMQAALGAQTGALPLVTIATPERLRTYVYVDQHDANYVRPGDKAEISLSERRDVHIEGVVARRSDELDPRTRMMLVEVDVDNREGVLVPGSFVTVKLSFATPPLVQIPAEALVMRGKQAFVPVVKEDVVRYRQVEVADDDGATVRLRTGLQAGELAALNLGENVSDGSRVQTLMPQAPPNPGGASPGGAARASAAGEGAGPPRGVDQAAAGQSADQHGASADQPRTAGRNAEQQAPARGDEPKASGGERYPKQRASAEPRSATVGQSANGR